MIYGWLSPQLCLRTTASQTRATFLEGEMVMMWWTRTCACVCRLWRSAVWSGIILVSSQLSSPISRFPRVPMDYNCTTWKCGQYHKTSPGHYKLIVAILVQRSLVSFPCWNVPKLWKVLVTSFFSIVRRRSEWVTFDNLAIDSRYFRWSVRLNLGPLFAWIDGGNIYALGWAMLLLPNPLLRQSESLAKRCLDFLQFSGVSLSEVYTCFLLSFA